MADGAISSEDFATLHRGTTEAIADVRDRLGLAESSELDETLRSATSNTYFGTPERCGKRAIYGANSQFSAEYFLVGCRGRETALEHP